MSFSKLLKSWSTRDILILVALAVVVAALTVVTSPLRATLEASLGAYGNRISMLASTLITFIIPYLIRKPGASMIGAILTGLLQLPFSPFGVVSMVGFIIGGIIVEILFAAGRYRNYSLSFILSITVAYNLITLAFVWVPQQIGQLGAVGIVAMFVLSVVIGAIAGWITVLIGNAMLNSGVLQMNQALEDEAEAL
ncbi:MAG: ECF transporter S component [Chloroflexota bacterium]